MNPRIPASMHIPRLRTILSLVRIVVFTCLTPAFAGDVQRQPQPEKVLAISVTLTPQNAITEALDARDLEHFIVSDLKHQRIVSAPSTSIEDSRESDDGVYALDFFIDQAEIAQRPRWDWTDRRYRDDEILHLEISVTATRLSDGEQVGSLNLFHDYRAEEYGRFSSPQAIRGAVYEAVADLSSSFATKLSEGVFGAELDTFQHPFAPADAIDYWQELSLETKAVTGILTLLALVMSIALACAILRGIFSGLARLFGLSQPAPQIVYLAGCSKGLRGRKASTVLGGYELPEQDDKDESEEDEEEEEEVAS